MKTITRIDSGSAFKVGAIVSAIVFAAFGLIGLVFQLVVLTPFFSSIGSDLSVNGGSASFSAFAGISMLSLACFYFVGIAMAAIGGGIGGLITAWAYNLAARWVGGLKVQFDSDGGDLLDEIGRDMDLKRKRGEL